MIGEDRARLLLVAGVLVLTGLVQQVFACTCLPPESPADELERSTAVFAGEVTSVKAPSGPITSSADPIAVTFQVYTVWKGSHSDTFTITTARSSASCGYPFETGKEYLVYAHGEADDLQVSLCSRTKPLTLASSDLVALGRKERADIGALLQAYKYPLIAPVVIVGALGVGMKLFFSRRMRL